MKDRASPRTLGLLLTTMTLAACTSAASGSSTAPSGTETLAPGEAKRVWIGAAYRWLSVCNDTTSQGTVTVTIDSRDSEVLAAGICTENSGGSIELANDRSGPALIVYRSQVNPGFPALTKTSRSWRKLLTRYCAKTSGRTAST